MISLTEYTALKANQSAYEKWAETYKQKNGWIVIPADAIRPVQFENEDRAKIEEYEFMTEKPLRLFAYYKAGSRDTFPIYGTITGFMGNVLARVQFASVPRVSNMGDKRIYFSALGINGVLYHGIAYVTNGDYCRMRAYKKQPKPKA